MGNPNGFCLCFASLVYLNKARFVETPAKMTASVFASIQNLNRADVEPANELAKFSLPLFHTVDPTLTTGFILI